MKAAAWRLRFYMYFTCTRSELQQKDLIYFYAAFEINKSESIFHG
jgi:hypothetical protein